MGWNRQTLEPQRTPSTNSNRSRFSSPPICRFIGAIGFVVCGILVFNQATDLLGVDPDFIRAQRSWEFKEIIALGGSILAAAFFGLLGFSLGASIPIRSETLNHKLTVLWHYLANGSIIWFVLLGLSLTKILGQDGTKQLFDQLGGRYSSFMLAGICGIGSIAIACTLLITGQLDIQTKPRFFPCLLLSLPVSAVMGYTQFWLLSLTNYHWIMISMVFPVALIPVSTMTIARDQQQRGKLTLREQK